MRISLDFTLHHQKKKMGKHKQFSHPRNFPKPVNMSDDHGNDQSASLHYSILVIIPRYRGGTVAKGGGRDTVFA